MAGKRFRPEWYRLYRQQRGNAKLRGIAFHLTSEEWWQIWQASGHFHERGRLSDQYCMARFGDVGPYAIGNVEITTTRQNNVIGSTGRTHTEEVKNKIRKAHIGIKKSEEHRQHLRKPKAGGHRPRGPMSRLTKFKISLARRRYHRRSK